MMKKCFVLFVMIYLVLSLSGCAVDHSPSSVGGNTAAGFYYNSLENIMGGATTYYDCLKGQHFIQYGGNKKRENTT